MSNMTDKKEINELENFAKGDDNAFGQLVNRYKERIYLVVLRIVKNNEDAKDLAQEAFVKAYINRQSFRAESGFFTWIYRIAVNLALNYISRNRDLRAESIDEFEQGKLIRGKPQRSYDHLLSSGSDNLEKEELAKTISAAIEKLPPRQRTVFVLRHYEEKPHAEIASILSITEGAVKASYHQAVQKLKESLGLYIKEGRLIS